MDLTVVGSDPVNPLAASNLRLARKVRSLIRSGGMNAGLARSGDGIAVLISLSEVVADEYLGAAVDAELIKSHDAVVIFTHQDGSYLVEVAPDARPDLLDTLTGIVKQAVSTPGPRSCTPLPCSSVCTAIPHRACPDEVLDAGTVVIGDLARDCVVLRAQDLAQMDTLTLQASLEIWEVAQTTSISPSTRLSIAIDQLAARLTLAERDHG